MHRNIAILLAASIAMESFGAADQAEAQTAAQVELVRTAMKAAYVRGRAIEAGKAATKDRFGWPANLVIKCTYVQWDNLPNGNTVDRKAVSEVIFPDPAVIARWVVPACQWLKNPSSASFST